MATNPKLKFVGPNYLSQQQLQQGNPWASVMAGPNAPTQAGIDESVNTGPSPEATQPMLDPSQLKLPDVGNKMGASALDRLSLDSENKSNTTKNTFFNAPELNDLISSIDQTKPVQEQRAGLAKLAELNNSVIKGLPTGVDLTPLMAWADSMNGTKLASSYKAPASYQDKAGLLLKYADENQKRMQDLTKDEIGNLQHYKTGSDLDSALQKFTQLLQMGQANKPPPGANPLTQDKYIIDNVKKINDDYESSDLPFQKMMGVLQSEHPTDQQVKLIAPLVARVISTDKGRLTQQMISNAMPKTLSRDLVGYESFLTSNPSVLLDPRVLGSLRQEVGAAREDNRQSHLSRLQDFRSSVNSSSYSARPVGNMISPYENNMQKNAPNPKADTAKSNAALKQITDSLKGL